VDKKPLKSKYLAIGIILLFIATCIIPGATQNIFLYKSIQKSYSVNRTENWTQIQKLLASDGATRDYFGYSVSLSGDTALIGAYWDDDNGDGSGSAYVFTRTGTTWTQQQKLLPSDGAEGDYFGISVSISSDTALIGANNDDDNGDLSGSAYVFVRDGTTWTQQAKLLAPDGEAWDQFGENVALDDDTALIGAPYDDNSTGSAYVFIRIGNFWYPNGILRASDRASWDVFGCSVCLNGDTAIIGTCGDDDNGENSGSAYVFTHTKTGWTQQEKLLALDSTSFDGFGFSVSLSSDTALISAPFSIYNKGSAYVFTQSGTNWTQKNKLLALDGAEYDNFGWAVALNGDIALIGAPYNDHYSNRSGSAYIFTDNGTTWTQQEKLLASDGAMEDVFGDSVSLDDHTALIGAYWDDDNGNRSGSAYVFIKENQPPIANFFWSPKHPVTNQPVTFDATASYDSDGTITTYEWDWNNDGITEENHTTPTATHAWTAPGTYSVNMSVIDNEGAATTIIKTVTVIGTIAFTLDIIGGFGIKATITNNGTINATAVKWKFTLIGGFILLGKTKSGTVTSLAAGESATAKDSPILGFGKTTIKVDITCEEGVSATQIKTGTVILFFILGVK
jgi:hypothetical protein